MASGKAAKCKCSRADGSPPAKVGHPGIIAYLLSVISGIGWNLVSNWIWDLITKGEAGRPAYAWYVVSPGIALLILLIVSLKFPPVKGAHRLLIVAGFLAIVLISGWMLVRATPTETAKGPELKITSISQSTIKATYSGVPHDDGHWYMLTCDLYHRYSSPQPITSKSGSYSYGIGTGIKSIAIVRTDEPLHLKEIPAQGLPVAEFTPQPTIEIELPIKNP